MDDIVAYDVTDELPEWAADDMGGGDEGGTFDSSGAFMSLKDVDCEELDKATPNGDAGSSSPRTMTSHNSSSKLSDRKQVQDLAICQ
mgnify:CR=1 FL=1